MHPITSMLRERESSTEGGRRDGGGGGDEETQPGKDMYRDAVAKGSITTPQTQKSQRDF